MLLVHRFSEPDRRRAPYNTELTDYRTSSSLLFHDPFTVQVSIGFQFKKWVEYDPQINIYINFFIKEFTLFKTIQ